MHDLRLPDTMEGLMTEWKNRIGQDEYFNADGMIDPACWKEQKNGRRILFVLKETNNLKDETNRKDISLTAWLMKEDSPKQYGSVWPRIAEWWHAIEHAEDSYTFYDATAAQAMLKHVAVMNLKKTPGGGSAKQDEVIQRIRDDWAYIQREIELIDPDIIVFCGTWWMIETVRPEFKKQIPYTCFVKTAFPDRSGKERLLIDYWHPAARYPAVMMYYGIQGIYRAARAEANKH